MRSSSRGGHAKQQGSGGGRYASTVEKGENQWQREWQGFISGVKMTEGGAQVKLPTCMDHEQSEGSTFSYLFGSSSMKKSSRESKVKKEKEEQKRKKQERELKRLKAAQERGEAVDVDWDDPFGERSKHQKTMLEAKKRGLQLEGMSRKQVREFLHLTVTKEQEAALAAQKELKPHELMDEKMQWYQQGPYPLDVISEKLVIKKAIKHAKQNGMRYNYLTVHPSWVASRARKRREVTKDHNLAAMGIKITFNDDGVVEDLLRLKALQLASQKSFMERNATSPVPSASPQPDDPSVVAATTDGSEDGPAAAVSPVTAAPQGTFLAPPNMGGFRKTLQNANLSTNYITSSFIHGPSLGIEDVKASGAGHVGQKAMMQHSTSSGRGGSYAATRSAQRQRDSGTKTIVISVNNDADVDEAETAARMRRAAFSSGAVDRNSLIDKKKAQRHEGKARKDSPEAPTKVKRLKSSGVNATKKVRPSSDE
jgi:hypothetical protein